MRKKLPFIIFFILIGCSNPNEQYWADGTTLKYEAKPITTDAGEQLYSQRWYDMKGRIEREQILEVQGITEKFEPKRCNNEDYGTGKYDPVTGRDEDGNYDSSKIYPLRRYEDVDQRLDYGLWSRIPLWAETIRYREWKYPDSDIMKHQNHSHENRTTGETSSVGGEFQYYKYADRSIFPGKVIERSPYNGIYLDASYKDCKRNGSYISYRGDGGIFEKGTYKNGEKDGLWIGYYNYVDGTGALRSEKNYKNGKEHGPYKTYHKNGQLEWDGTFKDGKEHGPYKTYHKNGQLEWDGTFKDGKEEGPYTYYWSNGDRAEGNYKNGEKDGPYRRYSEEGKLTKRGSYKNGEKDGLWTYYKYFKVPYGGGYYNKYVFGLDKTESWKEGKLHGPYKFYYVNGQVRYQGNSENGKKKGRYFKYKENGEVWDSGYY